MALSDVIHESAKKFLRFVKPSGNNNIGGPCPFHKDGKEHTPSFYINLRNGLYFCHACGEKGTFVQFLKAMGESSQKVDLVLELAREAKVNAPPKALDLHGKHFLKESLLGVFDYCPIKLVDDGFDEVLLQKMDVGFDREYERITFPIRDLYGSLVGVSGRTVTGAFPRYKVYKKEDLMRFASDDYADIAKYEQYEIKNHHYLWNMHNVYPKLFYTELDTVIVVEGYKACLWMLQQGFENTVALQGSRMSDVQEATLAKHDGWVIFFLDKNKAGMEGTADAGPRLINRGLNFLVCDYPDTFDEGAQPDNLSKEEIQNSLDTAKTFNEWRDEHGIFTKKKTYDGPRTTWVHREP
ncbi:Bacterial DnaG primase, TOPRIM domain [uncultured Caudovirales phage]|uniref:Bacterial DnaG primase, TOPRIM domain n=1 Tax=uncultured Caudovirales phage TaxID=2100421 RepID=A0A6J5LQ49_9CAUD|nr:Bacterial DnaG primase, TOPRIM domain [uncultured Caudovirales phage]CAB4135137.1 Bacterial DnaG primase, TOPRIM domain [uncultured Caudovirales phage]